MKILFTLLLLLPFTMSNCTVRQRRYYLEVIRDIERLQASGKGTEAEYLKLVNEIAGGVKDF